MVVAKHMRKSNLIFIALGEDAPAETIGNCE